MRGKVLGEFLLLAVYRTAQFTGELGVSRPESIDRTNQVGMFLEAAFLDAQDGKGNTALMVAASSKQLDTLRLLLAKGASPHIQNLNGDTALSLAQSGGDSEIVQALQAAAR
ncbi:ankyrin repeat domain-containing protein [Cupriavidus sp. CV2]|uniref:ankyrin repeat domain-containing protein n=1 Tax=Cupriavidus ulmosensis TaxID=3065913 RepID=UPI00296A90AC|nr:ankyrin repeat domain-containing protein [Cupriavidus sp. CV2]MDW3684266.1 ankyrin repeat domain-containing protein [Cupriavidus sp. CV2]